MELLLTREIQPIMQDEVIRIFIVEDDLDLDDAMKKIEKLNGLYPKYKFFDDFRDEPSFINGVRLIMDSII